MPKFLDQSALQYFWSKLKDSLLPGASSADNGKFLGIQNGEWVLATPETGGISYTIGAGLRVSGNTLMVDTATAVESGNTKPITSDAVYDAIGNVETLLSQI